MEGMKPELAVLDEARAFGDASSESPQLSYRYRDAGLVIIHHSSVPKDDEAALAYFHTVVRFGKDYMPVYCERIDRDPDGGNEKVTMLREIFDPVNCETKPFDL